MKTCCICKTNKELAAFNKKSKSKDGLQPQCRDCAKAWFRSYYENNTDSEKLRVKDRRDELKELYESWKSSQRCAICGESEKCCLDLHHRDKDQKTYSLAIMSKWGYSWESLKKEIEKCIVLCANCHRKVHAGVIDLRGQLSLD